MRRTMTALLVILAFSACTKEQATDELGAVKKANEVAAQASAHANVAAIEPLGVPECDSYLQNYESCLTGKMPAQDQQIYRVRLESQRREWQQMTADPTSHDTLVQQCKDATATANQTFAKYGCQF
jgi:hypothetical protein